MMRTWASKMTPTTEMPPHPPDSESLPCQTHIVQDFNSIRPPSFCMIQTCLHPAVGRTAIRLCYPVPAVSAFRVAGQICFSCNMSSPYGLQATTMSHTLPCIVQRALSVSSLVLLISVVLLTSIVLLFPCLKCMCHFSTEARGTHNTAFTAHMQTSL